MIAVNDTAIQTDPKEEKKRLAFRKTRRREGCLYLAAWINCGSENHFIKPLNQ